MIITCDSCSTRLSIDDAKIPAQTFNIRCGKCGSTINVRQSAADAEPPIVAASDTAVSSSSSTCPPVAQTGEGQDDIMRMLAQVLREATSGKQERDTGGRNWETKRVMICIQPEHRNQFASFFDEKGYEVFIPAGAMEALKQMREERMDVITLAPDFDAVEQGALFIMREISALRMPERRRIFLIQASPTARTADVHAAFVNSVNLVINTAELDRLPAAFDRAVREFRELYYDFNKAFDAVMR
jgi:predicted Zn finger-like uncharacterized protein